MNKKIILRTIIVAVALAVVFLAYRIFFVDQPGANSPQLVPLSSAGPGVASDDEFLSRLERFKAVNLDVAQVFNNPVWLSLKNFRRDLVPEPCGRRNPFAPPGVGSLDLPPDENPC